MQLRISSGSLKNKRLNVPASARPVKERVKLSVFSIIGDDIKGKKVLDLFAGTGNLGFESISRGASHATFIEHDYEAIGTLLTHVKELSTNTIRLKDITTIEKSDATKYIANHEDNYDIIFVDPPYEVHIIHILKYIHDSIEQDGLIIYFHDTNYQYNIEEINDQLKIIESRKYGLTTVDFIKRT